ncbi:endonuclease-reverse transcriptase domain-containing protein [Phthorimaea operculella]|nr:endonuclease-reverse transcriptase domain-containing protein [Phthorimaea operculella]
MTSDEHADKFNLPNYTHHFNIRNDKVGGGVSIYVHNNIKHSLSESVYSGGNNYLWVQLEKYALSVGVVYNPGDTDFEDFENTLEEQLHRRKRALVFGDFNINLLEKSSKKQKYINLLNAAGHKILNKIAKKYYTRGTATKKSILDHVCTNLRNENYNLALINSSLSDHRQIHLTLKKYKPPPREKVTYKALNYEKLYQVAEDIDNNIQDFQSLESTLKNYIDQSTERKVKILNLPQKDWINKDIINAINQRNELWAELQEDPKNDLLRNNFERKREFTANLIKSTKDTYYYKEYTNCSKDPRKLWNLTNYLSNNKPKSSCAPPKLVMDERHFTGDSSQHLSVLIADGRVTTRKSLRQCVQGDQTSRVFDATHHSPGHPSLPYSPGLLSVTGV